MKKLLYLLIILFLYNSCCKEKCQDQTNPECSNYDPCINAKETKANFRNYTYADDGRYKDMFTEFPDYQEISTSAGFWIIDTTQKYEYWEWHIGSEVIPMEKIVSRRNFPNKEEIPITLVVKNTPNKKCLPYDNGLDTITKNYLAVDYGSSDYDFPLVGTYEMQYISHPYVKDKFTFKIFSSSSKYLLDSIPDAVECYKGFGIDCLALGNNNEVIFESAICPPSRNGQKARIIWIRRKAKGSNEFEMKVKYDDYKTIYYATGKKIQ